MKYCYECGKMTAGEPLFCGTCGRSYDAKLCPRLHANPRGAQVCSHCGSRDLSTPQPKVPVTLQFLALVTRLGLGLLLLYATLTLVVAAVRSPAVQQHLIALGILLGTLWLLWSKLPDWFREAIRTFWKSRTHRDED